MKQYYARLTAGAGQAKAGKGIFSDEPIEENLQMLIGEKEFMPFVMFPAKLIGADS